MILHREDRLQEFALTPMHFTNGIWFHWQDAFADPENTQPLGEKAQIEVLLTTRMKSLETELAEARRDLLDARKQEVSCQRPSVYIHPLF